MIGANPENENEHEKGTEKNNETEKSNENDKSLFFLFVRKNIRPKTSEQVVALVPPALGRRAWEPRAWDK